MKYIKSAARLLDRDWVNKGGWDLSKEVLWVSGRDGPKPEALAEGRSFFAEGLAEGLKFKIFKKKKFKSFFKFFEKW